MRLVIDTNLVVSAVIRGGLPLAVIVRIVRSTEHVWVLSPSLLLEYLQVLSRPTMRFSALTHEEVIELVIQSPKEVVPNLHVEFRADPGDSKVLGTAISGRADFLLTGDHALLELRQIGVTKVVTAANWMNLTAQNPD